MPALIDSSRHGAIAARIFSSVPIICTASWSDSMPIALNTTIIGKSCTEQQQRQKNFSTHRRFCILCLLSSAYERGKRYGPRSFRVAAPFVWNNLPRHLRNDDISREQFARDLKTVLFARAYSSEVPLRTSV